VNRIDCPIIAESIGSADDRHIIHISSLSPEIMKPDCLVGICPKVSQMRVNGHQYLVNLGRSGKNIVYGVKCLRILLQKFIIFLTAKNPQQEKQNPTAL
jgi:hypothetical protein